MKTIEDNTEKVVLRRIKIIEDILNLTYDHVYECRCGLSFKVNALDIKYDGYYAFDFKNFGVRCPHCNEYHYIRTDIEWPSADDTFKDLKWLLVDKLKEQKKELKLKLKEEKRRKC